MRKAITIHGDISAAYRFGSQFVRPVSRDGDGWIATENADEVCYEVSMGLTMSGKEPRAVVRLEWCFPREGRSWRWLPIGDYWMTSGRVGTIRLLRGGGGPVNWNWKAIGIQWMPEGLAEMSRGSNEAHQPENIYDDVQLRG